MHNPQDTITAIATARGKAALAIVRLSGPNAVSIAGAVFRGRNLGEAASHTAHVGYVVSKAGVDIDQVVATLFRAPFSVTGEDVVEISCHGGDFSANAILDVLVAAGARLADPGEFTQRAFLNGKIDLAQAESIADLIHASSTMAHRVSLNQLQGRYSEKLQALRNELLELCAFIELELDFSEEDVSFADRQRLEGLLSRSFSLLQELVSSYRIGAYVRDGVRVVIAGKPNAGKSTLLNALVGRERAIVSEIPGTTRDEIEVDVEAGGVLFRFVDTAGLRETTDLIEAEGVRRTVQSVEQCDVLIYVYDVTEGLTADEKDFVDRAGVPVILLGNKVDLVADGASIGGATEAIQLSASRARTEVNLLEPLFERLAGIVALELSSTDLSAVVVNQRHRHHLQRALKAVRDATVSLETGSTGDVLSADLRFAVQELGAITGEITNEDVLDQIFSRFCIGK